MCQLWHGGGVLNSCTLLGLVWFEDKPYHILPSKLDRFEVSSHLVVSHVSDRGVEDSSRLAKV